MNIYAEHEKALSELQGQIMQLQQTCRRIKEELGVRIYIAQTRGALDSEIIYPTDEAAIRIIMDKNWRTSVDPENPDEQA